VDILSIGLLSLLHVSPVAKLVSSSRIAFAGLLRRYPVATIGLALSACLQAAQILAWWTAGNKGYAAAWAMLQPWQSLLMLCVAAECLWRLAQHFPLPRNVVALLVAVFGIVALAASLPASMALPWTPVAMRRHCKIVVLTVLGLSRISLVSAEPGMRPNVRRYSTAVLVGLGGSVAGDVIFSFGRSYWIVAAGQTVLMLSPLAACRWWLGMSKAGEQWEPTPGPRPEDLDEELNRVHDAIKAKRASAGE